MEMILWVRAGQIEARDACTARHAPALISPSNGGVVTVVTPVTIEIGDMFAHTPHSCLATVPADDGGPNLVLTTRLPGLAAESIRWAAPVSEDDLPTLISPPELIETCAAQLVALFTPPPGEAAGVHIPRDGVIGDATDGDRPREVGDGVGGDRPREARDAIVRGTGVARDAIVRGAGVVDEVVQVFHELDGWMGELIDALNGVLPLPEVREQIDQRLCIGPHGPAIMHPGMVTGPVEYAPFAEYIYIARSLSPDARIRQLFGPLWSSAVDKRFDVMEIGTYQNSAFVKLIHDSVPQAVTIWGIRWLVTPAAPESVTEEFVAELHRACPWPWDPAEVSAIIRDPEWENPLPAMCEALKVPSIMPFIEEPDWTTLGRRLRRIEPATGLRLTTAKMVNHAVSLLPIGPWAKWRIKVQGRSPHWVD
ncbi:MAG: hypothetical protein FWD59_07050 [Micrococcales bacterium]|nr:hypothetical protein [Micrococcales bacterium]